VPRRRRRRAGPARRAAVGVAGHDRCWRRAVAMPGTVGVSTLEVETLDDAGQTVRSWRVDGAVQQRYDVARSPPRSGRARAPGVEEGPGGRGGRWTPQVSSWRYAWAGSRRAPAGARLGPPPIGERS
jgi:hypothetical protein